VESELKQSRRKYVLCILDDSEIEKPESSQWEGLAFCGEMEKGE
jgi:hypothetical protein